VGVSFPSIEDETDKISEKMFYSFQNPGRWEKIKHPAYLRALLHQPLPDQ
jgi:hypothetical protein